jgi:hypothetical protein
LQGSKRRDESLETRARGTGERAEGGRAGTESMATALGGTAGRVKAALAVLVAEGSDEVARGDACAELRQLAANSAGKVALMQAGAVEPLTAMLRTAGDDARDTMYLGGGMGAAATCLVSSLGDAESSLGDAKSSLGDAKSSRWVTLRARWVTLRARWVTLRVLAGRR